MTTYTHNDLLAALKALRDHKRGMKGDDQLEFMRFCLKHASSSYGQFLQDLWVLFELGSRRNGFFVEFGGADGIGSSNTYLLEQEYDWSGIVAEPSRHWHPAIRRNRRCFVDDRCVWTKSDETLQFNQARVPLHSTIERFSGSDHLSASRDGGTVYGVRTVSLNDLLDFWNAPRRVDYVSIDTEGSELDILNAFDFDKWDVRLFSIEHNHTAQRELIHSLMASKGYQRRFERISEVDDWYVKVY